MTLARKETICTKLILLREARVRKKGVRIIRRALSKSASVNLSTYRRTILRPSLRRNQGVTNLSKSAPRRWLCCRSAAGYRGDLPEGEEGSQKPQPGRQRSYSYSGATHVRYCGDSHRSPRFDIPFQIIQEAAPTSLGAEAAHLLQVEDQLALAVIPGDKIGIGPLRPLSVEPHLDGLRVKFAGDIGSVDIAGDICAPVS